MKHMRRQPLQDLLAPPDELRFEIKTALPITALAHLRGWLGTHGLAVAFPDRVVNTMYFDTEDFDCLQSADAGIADRVKARVRWYGATEHPQAARFEAKCKRGQAGYKVVQQLGGPFDFRTCTWMQIRDQVRAQLPDALRLLLDTTSRAASCNRYHRTYLASRDGALRATIDRDLILWPQHGMRPQWTRTAILEPLVILEIKAPIADRERVSELMRDAPGRPSRLSKYALALEQSRF